MIEIIFLVMVVSIGFRVYVTKNECVITHTIIIIVIVVSGTEGRR